MTIGTRLREVRQALNMSQTEFGAAGGVLKNAQSSYETNKRSPDANYLAKIALLGADVNYIITGTKLTDTQQQLLKTSELLSDKQQSALLLFLTSITKDSV